MSGELELSRVLEESPAAVLVIDLSTRQIVHVNDVAEQLAPDTRLPVGLDTWSDVAELRDPDGAELSDTTHPLSRVARAEPVAGQAVSAARRSAMGARREPLWMVAMPMTGAPMLEGHALVVLIPLRHSRAAALLTTMDDGVGADAARVVVDQIASGGDLTNRALDATALAVTVADAFDPEQPLVWVNPAFTATTGYTAEEAIGQNCRFLQGPETDAAGPRRLREAVEQGVSVSVTLLNYRKDGSTFWNQVDLSPVLDTDGRIAHYVGIQTDVSRRVEADLETRRALEAERVARADAESARSRVTYLIDAVNQLSGTMQVADCAERLMSLVVPYLADWAVLVHGDGTASSPMAGRHRHARRQHEVDSLMRDLPAALRSGTVADLLLDGREVRLIPLSDPASDAARAGYLRDLSFTERTRALDGHQALMVALAGRSEVSDVLVLVRTPHRQEFSEEDVDMALDLGRRAGLIIENATLFQAQARIAEVLQRSLLPRLPEVSGVGAAARYLANESSAEVGGDFYQLLDFGERGIGISIGDVSGHDILAAAAMGNLKGMLRAVAYDGSTPPAEVLERVDHLMIGLAVPTLATAIFAHATPYDGDDGGGWLLTWSAAGHLPMLVRHPGGAVDVLPSEHNDTLLGLGEIARTQHEVRVPHGATVIAYTDGLVERRGESLDVGLARLTRAVAEAPQDVEELCDHVLAAMGHGARDDDIALLVVTLA